MEKPRFRKTEAIVLRHFPIGEADRVVTLYTPYAGKLRAVARGARRVKSRLAGHIEPLTRTRVFVTRGRSLDHISQAETVNGNVALRADLWRTTCGLYLAELVDRFGMEELENVALYRLLRDCLEALADAPDTALVLRYFELRMLRLVGFLPELRHCVECGAQLAPETNYFSPAAGGVLCPSCREKSTVVRPISVNALKVLRLFATSDLAAASGVRLTDDLAVELDNTMRQYIRYILERDLKSPEFLDLLRKQQLPA